VLFFIYLVGGKTRDPTKSADRRLQKNITLMRVRIYYSLISKMQLPNTNSRDVRLPLNCELIQISTARSWQILLWCLLK